MLARMEPLLILAFVLGVGALLLGAAGRRAAGCPAARPARFPGALIVRLPGLFGAGLKKNLIYDFVHDNRLDLIHPDGQFQFYDLERIEPCES